MDSVGTKAVGQLGRSSFAFLFHGRNDWLMKKNAKVYPVGSVKLTKQNGISHVFFKEKPWNITFPGSYVSCYRHVTAKSPWKPSWERKTITFPFWVLVVFRGRTSKNFWGVCIGPRNNHTFCKLRFFGSGFGGGKLSTLGWHETWVIWGLVKRFRNLMA